MCVWILLTVLKFQTRLKESLFLRLILLSSHTGGNPLTAHSTCLDHANTHENSRARMCSRWQSYLRQEIHADRWLARSHASAHLSHTHQKNDVLKLHSVNELFSPTISYTSPSLSHTHTHSSTHLADRLSRKFHSLADARTHTHTHSVSIVTRPHRAAVVVKGREQRWVCQSGCSTAFTSPPTSYSSLFKSQFCKFRFDLMFSNDFSNKLSSLQCVL